MHTITLHTRFTCLRYRRTRRSCSFGPQCGGLGGGTKGQQSAHAPPSRSHLPVLPPLLLLLPRPPSQWQPWCWLTTKGLRKYRREVDYHHLGRRRLRRCRRRLVRDLEPEAERAVLYVVFFPLPGHKPWPWPTTLTPWTPSSRRLNGESKNVVITYPIYTCRICLKLYPTSFVPQVPPSLLPPHPPSLRHLVPASLQHPVPPLSPLSSSPPPAPPPLLPSNRRSLASSLPPPVFAAELMNRRYRGRASLGPEVRGRQRRVSVLQDVGLTGFTA